MNNMEDAIIVHSPEYANWIFDASHPTQGRRFLHGRNQIILKGQDRRLNIDEIEPEIPHTDDLLLCHDPIYVHDVTVKGLSSEWEGARHDLGDLAKLFVGGTLTALDALIEQKTKLAIHLPGAKHHAMRDFSSGFCIFGDFAIAATKVTNMGKKVAIFDCDAHHGDGTEELLRGNQNALTFSVHQYGIFPGTGLLSDWENAAINFPLAEGTGDEGLDMASESFIEVAKAFQPDYIFIACGADGLGADPLSELDYTVDGYANTMKKIRSQFPHTPILFGGAGGYLPDSGTPAAWSEAALALV
jgi:acetoin utilization deacetylase AcuC-like enzyme